MTAMLLQMQLGWGETLKTALVGFIIVLCILAVIALLIRLISAIFSSVEKAIGKSKKNNAAAPAPVTETKTASGRQLSATESQGELKLENVDEPTAAVIMAIVSSQSGIPLNRLAFKSIKLIEEK